MTIEDKRRLRLSKAYSWSSTETGIAFRGDAILHLRGPLRSLVPWAKRLERGATFAALTSGHSWWPDVKKLVEKLVELNIVVSDYRNGWKGSPVEKHVDFFFSLGVDGDAAQRSLARAHVTVLGVGGVGGVVLQHLAAAGIGEFTLIDRDVVQASNLNRQFIFDLKQVGQDKVVAAARYLRRVNSGAVVHTHKTNVRSARTLKAIHRDRRIDFLVLAADRPVSRIESIVCEFCRDATTPFLGGGCGLRFAAWGPLVQPSSAEQHLRYLETRSVRTPSALRALPNARKPPPVSFGPINTLAGAAIAQDVLLYLAGIPADSEGAALRYDTLPARLTRVDIVYDG